MSRTPFAVVCCLALGLSVAAACGDDFEPSPPAGAGGGATTTSAGTTTAAGGAGGTTSTTTTGTGGGGGGGGGGSLPSEVAVQLSAQNGVNGMQRVNFAVPLAAGQLSDDSAVTVLVAGQEIAAGRRGLATHADGSLRSVQLQVEVDVDTVSELTVRIGQAPGSNALTLVPVADTLVQPDGEQGPRVWALLPASWLSASRIAGPLLPETDVTGDGASWATLCDYESWDTTDFLAAGASSTASVWLYDRGTAMYRGYARRGDQPPLEFAYIETSMYRNAISGTGTATRNGVPGVAADVKYSYAQNLALHYLLTGDDRFRESAEDMALGVSDLWLSPGYAGGADFWTERHAGFALLAYVWAAIVSDDQKATFDGLADAAISAYFDVQETYPAGYSDPDARCFAHHADAHGEVYGYFGCSPWMSAILADGLQVYIDEGGTHATTATASLVKLGRILARDGRDGNDVPYYWMGVGTTQDEVDGFDEHIGESAYVIAMAWHYDGKGDAMLKSAADALVTKFAADGVAGQLRSFNWQCRSAVAAPWFLQP
jgi:hypothetical protein